jgi:hypothetical protein
MSNRTERKERAEARAERAEARAGAAQDTYQRQPAHQIPLGQPILVGHHSEGRHRRDLARADRALGNAVHADRAAKDAAERARTSGHAIQVGDDDATAALRAKIQEAEATHAAYTRHNREARKGTHAIGEECSGCKLFARDGAHMMTEGIRLPPYVLTNSRGRIKQAKQQLLKAQKVAERKTEAANQDQCAPPLATGQGWQICNDIEDDRVRVYFDWKPPAELRAIVNGYGFRWSPTVGAWQRQNTANGMYAARRVAAALTRETKNRSNEVFMFRANVVVT